MKIPRLVLPHPLKVPQIDLKVPSANIPTFPPIVLPPSDLRAPEGVEKEPTEETPVPEVRKLDIPIINVQMPVPEPEIVITAVTTAVIAVATTTVAQTFFEPIQKQVKKQLQKRVDAWKKKRKEKEISLTESKENEENLKKNK